MSTIEQNKTRARRVAEELWTRKNKAVIDELIAPNFTMQTPDGEVKGQDGFRKFFAMYTTAFPDLTLTVDDLLAEGDKVMMAFTVRGIHKGKLKDIDPTNRKVEIKGQTLVTFSNGKAIRENTVWDTLGMMQQLGVVHAIEHSAR